MPITFDQACSLVETAIEYKFPKILERLRQIGDDNLTKYMTPERFSKVKNAMLYNDPSKALKALELLPNHEPAQEPATTNQTYAIYRIGFQWFMPQEIRKLALDKDLEKLTKLQASTIISRLKRIEGATQKADDIDTAANPLDVETVTILLKQLPKAETV